MNTVIKANHEDAFLEQGYYFALCFREGWLVARVVNKGWTNIQPWSLGAVAAGANLAAYDEVQDANARHYLEPFKNEIVYHTFWGVTPGTARIKWQLPSGQDIGNTRGTNRSLTDNTGFIDGGESPFNGPFSLATEIFTVKERYPAFQVYNPTGDAMINVMLRFAQRQYSYQVITEKPLIKDLLTGTRRIKKFTMGTADPLPMTIPQWLQDQVGDEILSYTNDVMSGRK